MEFSHEPVMLVECIDALNIRPDGIYIDGTLGGGGHSYEIARRLTSGKLIAIDRDETAIVYAGEKLSEFANRVKIVRGNFRDLALILNELGIDKADGMLFDLGVSSPQLDDSERGFSYMSDAARLDMRMDPESPLSAYEVVNEWAEDMLVKILFEYGEERYARRIASAIRAARETKPIETTVELVDIIKKAMPAAALREKQHPAKRTFQAIRIAVNDELGAIEQMLEAAPGLLRSGGRLAIITFHSLEDRLVKTAFQSGAKGCTCPPEFPVCVCGNTPKLKIISRKPIIAAEAEIRNNPRSRSAKLRVAEKI